MLSPDDIDAEGANEEVDVLFAPDDATEVEYDDNVGTTPGLCWGLLFAGVFLALANI